MQVWRIMVDPISNQTHILHYVLFKIHNDLLSIFISTSLVQYPHRFYILWQCFPHFSFVLQFSRSVAPKRKKIDASGKIMFYSIILQLPEPIYILYLYLFPEIPKIFLFLFLRFFRIL